MTKTVHSLLSHYSSAKWGKGKRALILNFGRYEWYLFQGVLIRKGEGQIPGFPVSINFKNKTDNQTNKASLYTLSLIIFRCPLQIPS